MIRHRVIVAIGSAKSILQRTPGDEGCAASAGRSYRILCLVIALIVVCLVLTGCPEFVSIEQPSSVSPGEVFTVFIEATTTEVPGSGRTYFGMRLPQGWTIRGNAIAWTGAYYNGVITYDANLALEQETLSPSPEGYYWWVGDANTAGVEERSVYTEIQIQTSGQLGLYSVDYMLGNSWDGLNLHRSDNHLITIVDEYTPRGLTPTFQGDSVLLSWTAPRTSENIAGYKVYRDGQLIDTIPDENTEYTDEDLPGGVFHYSVSAVYEHGQEHLTPYEVDGLVFSGGSGEPNDPYQIASAEQLVCIADFPSLTDESFILINNIDLDPNLRGETLFEQSVIPRLSGTFDGNGFVISNMTLTGFGHLGLIGTIEDGGLVQNLGVVDANITGDGIHIGIVAGFNEGRVSNSYSTGTVSGLTLVGGLVGINVGTITSCYSTGTVNGVGTVYERGVGGLVGGNGEEDVYTGGIIISCYSTSSVSGDGCVGGLVGCNNDGSITSCYSTGSVRGFYRLGGLVGLNAGTIRSNYSTGSVYGDGYAGGLVGYNWGSITSCYSTTLVDGNDNVGGLVALNSGSITSCFWNMETSGQVISDSGTGLITTEMQTAEIFLDASWDFVGETANGTSNFWVMQEGSYPSLAAFSGYSPEEPDGSGTLNDPYVLTDAIDLGTVWCHPGACYRLEADIDLSGITWSMAVIPGFGGSFDGNGHVIYHLEIEGGGYLGLFGTCMSEATISNLGLEAADVNGTDYYVGGLVVDNKGSITSCYSTGSVSGSDYVGGLVADNKGSVTLCYSTSLASGNDYVGGLVGRNNDKGTITTSYSTGLVTGDEGIGGLVASNSGGSITLCYNTGSVSGNDYVGGLVARNTNKGTITTSYSTGSVTGTRYTVGGLVGYNNEGDITSCYSTGLVTGRNSDGGLVAFNFEGNITSSFWDIQNAGQPTSDGGTGKTTAGMQTESSFIDAGWDFIGEIENGPDDIWWISEGRGYPRLWWEELYVDDDAPNDPGPGDRQISDRLEDGHRGHPFDTIQEAIDFAPDHLTVLVQPGQYLTPDPWISESIRFCGKNIVLRSVKPTNPEVARDTVIRGAVLFSGTEDPNCTLTGFKIHSFGYGGISGNHTHATISHCIISGNGPCGGTVMKDCDGTISNCLITDNTTFFSCGTFPVIFGCNGLIKNCTIANNISGIVVGTAQIENCIIYDNEGPQLGVSSGGNASISYSNIQGGLNDITGEGVTDWGLGNTDADPGFVRFGYWVDEPLQLLEGDYHLRSEGWRWNQESKSWTYDYMTSPCIDAGNPDTPSGEELMTVPRDPDNEYGVNVRINMGAYGGTVQASMPPNR